MCVHLAALKGPTCFVPTEQFASSSLLQLFLRGRKERREGGRRETAWKTRNNNEGRLKKFWINSAFSNVYPFLSHSAAPR